jgi:hypothetical protein
MTLEVMPNGTIRCLYTNEVNLAELGRLNINRASHVEFDNHLRRWVVTSAKTEKRLHSAATREEALEWEHQYYSPGGGGWEEISDG